MNYFSVLTEHKNFGKFWLVQTICAVGGWCQTTALNWMLAENISSSFWLAITHSLWFLAVAFVLPFGGWIGDNYSRRRLILLTKIGTLATTVFFIALFQNESSPLFYSFGLFALGVIWAIEQPAYQSLIPSLVPEKSLSKALSLNYLSFHGSRFASPLLVGTLAIFYSPIYIFNFNAVILAGAIFLLQSIKFPKQLYKAENLNSSRNSLMQYIKNNKYLLILLKANLLNCFFILPCVTSLAARYTQLLLNSSNPTDFSAVMAAISGGAILGVILMPKYLRKDEKYRWKISIALPFTPLLLLAFANKIILILILMFFLSLSLSLAQSVTQLILQRKVNDSYRSRMLSLNLWIFSVATPLSSILQGFLIDNWGLKPTIVLYAAAFIITVYFFLFTQKHAWEAVDLSHAAIIS